MFAFGHRDRIAAGIGSIGVVAAIGYALLIGLNVSLRIAADHPLVLMDLKPLPPSVRISPPPKPRKKATLMRERASAVNRERQASPVVAPLILPPVPSPVIAAPVRNAGSAIDNGASTLSGPGHGAGGAGDGTGGGGDGDGGDSPPRQIKGKLNFSDMPGMLRVTGAEHSAAVRYQVDVNGRVQHCTVTRSTGSPQFDDIVCQLIESRFRFKPSRDADGHPVPSVVEEEHSWKLNSPKSGEGAL